MSNAYIYSHPFRSDGTSPSLLQGLAYGNCVVANSSPETKAALRGAGLLFTRDSLYSLAEILQYLIGNPGKVEAYRQKGLEMANKVYNWDIIVQQYEDIFYKAMKKKRNLFKLHF